MIKYKEFLKNGDYSKAKILFENLGNRWISRLFVIPNGNSFKSGYTIMQSRVSGGKRAVKKHAKHAENHGFPVEIVLKEQD